MTAPVIWWASMLASLTALRPFLRPGRIAVVEERSIAALASPDHG
jgi:hypothetical protein